MIFTSYFGGLETVHPSRRIVSIARKPPSGMTLESYSPLFPSAELLGTYKRGNLSPDEYETHYREETLGALNPEKVKRDLDGAVLLCYEMPGEFCHRKVVRRWLAEHGILSLEYQNRYSVAVVGSRSYDNYSEFCTILSAFVKRFDDGQHLRFVSGDAEGADRFCERFAKEKSFEIAIHRPDWKRFGRKAGFLRNETIWEESDLGIAFWNGRSPGTAHSIDLARRQHKPLVVYNFEKKSFQVQHNLLLVNGQGVLF